MEALNYALKVRSQCTISVLCMEGWLADLPWLSALPCSAVWPVRLLLLSATEHEQRDWQHDGVCGEPGAECRGAGGPQYGRLGPAPAP